MIDIPPKELVQMDRKQLGEIVIAMNTGYLACIKLRDLGVNEIPEADAIRLGNMVNLLWEAWKRD